MSLEIKNILLASDEMYVTDLLAILARLHGKRAHLKPETICGLMEYAFNHQTFTLARLKRITKYLRYSGALPNLICTRQGYYISTDQAEVNRYCAAMKARAQGLLNAAEYYQNIKKEV